MKSNFIKKIMALIIVSITLITALPIGASADWKNNNGQWSYYDNNGTQVRNDWLYHQKADKWYHFDSNGVMQSNSWISSDNKWYYLNSDGTLAKNTTTPDGYKVGNDGVWIQNNTVSNIGNTTTTNNTNNGIINNGGVNTNIINNGTIINGNNTPNNSNTNQNDTNVVLPIQIPSTWTKLTNTTYLINGRSAFAYDVRDTSGYSANKIIIDVNQNLLNKNYDVKIDGGNYNGNEAYVFNYLTNTNSGLEKAFYVVIFKNNKMYGFMMVSKNEDYDKDKQELENVLNTTLVLK